MLNVTRLRLAAARAAFAALFGQVLPPEIQLAAFQQPFRLTKPTGAKQYRPNPRGYYSVNGPVPCARRRRQAGLI